MKILISNDDGIQSEGICALAKSLSEIGEVYVVAPSEERSAIGHAITMHQPLRCKRVKFFDTDLPAWSVNGTPADCVKLGVESLMGQRPDLIVSGINKGENLGTDVLYSGTVSAAVEGIIFGIPSLAFSHTYSEKGYDFSISARAAKKIVLEAMSKGIPKSTMLNVNIPPCSSYEEIAGISFVKLGEKKYKNNFEQRKDPRGNTYYWLVGDIIDEEPEEKTDVHAIKNNYIAITPIHIDLTDYVQLEKMKQWNIVK